MKLFRYFLIPLVSAAMLVSCGTEESEESKAILAGESEITVPAESTTKTVTIYADGSWVADVTDTWLSIDPTSGYGTVDVTLNVDANLSDAAREAKIIVKGASALSDVEIAVKQKMDRFRETAAKTVTEALSLKEGDLAKISECQVMALSSKGFVVSDGTSNLFVLGSDASLKAGCKLTLTGDVVAFNNITAIQLEDAFFASEGEATYPEAKDVTETEGYAPGKVEYISATASFAAGGVLSVNDKKFATVYNNTDDFDNAYSYHKVLVSGYYLGSEKDVHSVMAVAFEDKGMEAIPYLQFEIGTSAFASANKSKIGESHQFASTVGNGYIKYETNDLAGSDPDGVWKMDVSGNDPRCTGPWYGDYWHFVGGSAVKANSEFKLQFGTRTSASGPKYWTLEYLDGTVWKPIGTVKESTDITEGGNVTYTHAMNADGQTNIIVDEAFTITKNMDRLELRFRCMSNWKANNSGVLTKRNTGSARLSVYSGGSSKTPVTAPQPSILITKMGDGNATVDPEPEYADITLSTPLLTFEGAPEGPKTLKITSDHDFTVKSNVSWLTLSASEGSANSTSEISVTCEPSDQSKLREGKITVTSADSQVEVYVVQSAAGQELDSFISVSSGNAMNAGSGESTLKIKVQSNVPFESKSDVDWLTFAPQTKALVEWTDVTVVVAASTDLTERVGHITFFNTENNLQTVVTVTQAAYVPPAAGELFSDDFSWMSPLISDYNKTASKPIGKSVEDNDPGAEAPNGYGAAVSIITGFYEKGYVDIHPEWKVMYPQDAYWKMGKTCDKKVGTNGKYNVTGIVLPDFLAKNKASKVKVAFNWACHRRVLNEGKENETYETDPVKVVVEVIKDLDYVTDASRAATYNVVSTSEAFVTTQPVDKMEWQTASVVLEGLSAGMRVLIRPENMKPAASTVNRWYIDNIKVTKVD